MISKKEDIVTPLKEKIALVTGASRGLGKGIAQALGKAGATVYVTGRTENSANAASRRVMEKVGMSFRRAFRPTLAYLKNADTAHTTSAEVWDGDEVAYALEKSDWEQQQAID